MSKKTSSRPHYAWCVLIACCMIQGGIIGLVQNCRGLFYNPVCTELGFSVSSFALYSTAHGIAAFCMLPFASRWIAKFPIRGVLSAATILFAGTTALMGSMSTLPQFYLVGAMQGIGGAFLLFLPVPILLNNWFHIRFGTAMGISASFSGVVGVLANPVFSWCISNYGWRMGYRILGASCFLLVMPAILFLVIRCPADRGMLPYGAEQIKQPAPIEAPSLAADPVVSRRPASSGERVALVCSVIFAACAGFSCSYCQHFANYASSLGFPAAVGAMLVSASMIGNIIGKLGLGAAGDHFGVRRTIVISSAVVGVSYLVFCIPQATILFPTAVVAGIAMPISVVCVPMLVKALFPADRYNEYYSYATMATSLMTSVSLAMIGALYDIAGTYLLAFWVGTGLTVLCILLTLLAFRMVSPNRCAKRSL